MLTSNFHNIRQAWVPSRDTLSPCFLRLGNSASPGERGLILTVTGQGMLGPFGEERGTPTFTGSGHLGPFLGDPQFLFSSATMPESWVFFWGGVNLCS